MARKTAYEAKKEAQPIVGTQTPIEGQAALDNFEHLAKKIFATKSNKK
jgi:hypothetical protein